jgi:YD repeat-containing protein
VTIEALKHGTTLIRSIGHYYTTLDNGTSYIVDRPWVDATLDSAGRLLAITDYFYDGQNSTPNVVGAIGDLTRMAKYEDVPLTSNIVNVTLHGQDTTFTYNAWGNRQSETTYAQAGTWLFNGSSWTISAPGNGSAARTSITGYDTVFHALPTSFSNALSQSESATAQDSAGFLQFGPYTAAGLTGANVARWNLLIDNNSADNAAVVQLDVHDATIGTVLASRVVTRREWTTTGQYQEFALPFILDSSRAGHALEYRVYWYDAAYVRRQQVRVTRLSGATTESISTTPTASGRPRRSAG